MVEVTQADREAAWPFADFHCLPDTQMRERWFSGYYDNLPQGRAIQAFSTNRIAERERCARVVEKFTQDIKNWHGGQAAERIWTAIRITQ